ncbi:MAG: UDP-glucose--hexose-1-phosphate uridylyltransferase [Thermoflexales bacterium]
MHLPHRRYNPLIGEWVLVSPQRATRPWLGAVERLPASTRPAYDPQCYLCPGNRRASGAVNPHYEEVLVFDNDFPALLPISSASDTSEDAHPLFRQEAESGVCRVICFSPRHDLTLAELPTALIRRVVDVWAEQSAQLGAREDITYVQIFENKGEMMGASNPHPHGQIWATRHLPNEIVKETHMQAAYLAKHGERLLCAYAAEELRREERVVFENGAFVCVVPFWAVWPFETLLLPKRHVRHIEALLPAERDALADALKRLTVRYDNLFETSFPYSMGVHQAPHDGQAHEGWQLHLHFYPPLLRNATVRKFMVGYELLAQPQRDLTPEQAAQRLRALSEQRFA